MTQDEALKLIINTKSISPFTRNFIFWLYKNDYLIISPEEKKEIDGALLLQALHGGEILEELNEHIR